MSESFIKSAESVEKFLDALEARGLLSDQMMEKLRARLADAERPLTAKAVAKFLVDKGYLSQTIATEVLSSLVRSGVDVDPAPGEEAAGADAAEEATPIISPRSAVELSENPLPQMPANAAEEDNEGSSIFEAFPSSRYNEEEERGPEEDIGLAPDSELDAVDEDRPLRAAHKPAVEKPVAESPALAGFFGEAESKKPRRETRPARPLVDESRETPLAEVQTGAPTKIKRRKKDKKQAKRTSEWDSPLILLGGGGLAVLLLGGLTIAWLLNTESADELLVRAQKGMDSGSYTQAIAEYQQFLKKFPRHRDQGLARVKLAMAQLRKATEAGNLEIALDVARTELEQIENEEKFGELAHAELAALLPRIALGLAKEADAAADPETAKRLVEKSTAALALAANTKYLPKSLRDETELDDVRETLARIERRQKSQQDLRQAIAAMQAAVAAGDTRAAYAHHARFIKQYPQLTHDASLGEMLHKITAAEKAAIQFTADERRPEITERPTPWLASLAVANRRVKPDATPSAEASRAVPVPVPGPVAPVCLRIDGAVYAVDTASGRLLWRRHVGFARPRWPLPVDDQVLVADTQHNELLLLDTASGRLLWRQLIGEPFAQPLVVGKRVFVPSDSGRLYVLDTQSGARAGYVEFAQPLRVTPAVDKEQQRLYLPGDHSSLYTLSLDDLSCLGVYYLGHAEGSVAAPPVAVMNKLVVLVNDGVETSRLRLLSLANDGSVADQVLQKRLAGLATSPPLASGRRLVVATDHGEISVFEVSPGDGEEALTLVAARAAAGAKSVARHSIIAGKHIWVGDTRLTKYSILPTGNRLPVEPIEASFDGAVSDHPLLLAGKTLVHAHQPKGRAGVVVAAVDTEQGRTLWETDLAMPPAGSPVVDDSSRSLVAATAEGSLFRFDETAIRARVQDEPLAADMLPADLPALSFAVDLGKGRAAFGSVDSDRLLLFNPTAAGSPARWIQLPSPLACAATPWADGLVAPLRIGQVFQLSSADAAPRSTPFQPLLQPETKYQYQPAAIVDQSQFAISDGDEKLYLVALIDQPQPHLKAVAEAKTPFPIERPLCVLANSVVGVGDSSRLVRFTLPSLEAAGEASLPAPVTWGPFLAGNALLLATADEQLIAISATGEIAWQTPIEHGDLAGAPLIADGSVLLAYRSGAIERRSLADGKPQATIDVQQPLAAGPVRFLQRLVLTAADGTLLVIDQP